MNSRTAKMLNWQVSTYLGLDPSEPRVVSEAVECGCYSEVTRDDYSLIYVDDIKVPSYAFYSISSFIRAMTEQGEPETLEGVAEATVVEATDFECQYGEYY